MKRQSYFYLITYVYGHVLYGMHYFFRFLLSQIMQTTPSRASAHHRGSYKTGGPPPWRVFVGRYPTRDKSTGGSAQSGWDSRWSCKVSRRLFSQIPTLFLLLHQTSIWSTRR